MLNTEAVEVIQRHRSDAIVVCTMTTIFTFAQARPNDLNIRCAPLMGGASSIGLGLALARPDRRVIVLDGDGSLLMQLGTLATIAGSGARNLYHFVCDNHVLYEGGGRVPIAGPPSLDFPGLASSAGYPLTWSFDDHESLDDALPGILESEGPAFVRLAIDTPPTPGWSNENPQTELPDWWFTMMREDGERVKAILTEGAEKWR